MIVDIIVFAVMAYFYVPSRGNEAKSDLNENENENEKPMQLEALKNKGDWEEWRRVAKALLCVQSGPHCT